MGGTKPPENRRKQDIFYLCFTDLLPDKGEKYKTLALKRKIKKLKTHLCQMCQSNKKVFSNFFFKLLSSFQI